MSSQYDNGMITLIAATNLEAFVRVSLTGSGAITAALCGDEANAVGITQEAIASGEPGLVKLIPGGSGTFKCQVAGVITAGNVCYPAANGEIEATGTAACGWVLETSTAQGDVVECVMLR